jgi:hypothetical protein
MKQCLCGNSRDGSVMPPSWQSEGLLWGAGIKGLRFSPGPQRPLKASWIVGWCLASRSLEGQGRRAF